MSPVGRPLPASYPPPGGASDSSPGAGPRPRRGGRLRPRRLLARLLVSRRARLRRRRPGDERPGIVAPAVPEREALLGEADPLLLDDGRDDPVHRRRRRSRCAANPLDPVGGLPRVRRHPSRRMARRPAGGSPGRGDDGGGAPRLLAGAVHPDRRLLHGPPLRRVRGPDARRARRRPEGAVGLGVPRPPAARRPDERAPGDRPDRARRPGPVRVRRGACARSSTCGRSAERSSPSRSSSRGTGSRPGPAGRSTRTT